MNTIEKIQEDKIGKYNFKFKYSPKNSLTEIYNPNTGHVVLSTEYFNESDIEVCFQEFSDLTQSQRKELGKALIELTYLYRFGGSVDGKIQTSDIINQLKNS